MVVCVSADSYARVIQYGMHKTKLQWPRLFLQSCMAGIYVGMAGHSCTVFAGGFPTDPTDPLAISKVLQSFCYAIIFPVAFISIIFTGAELFTGNTMTMLICVLEKRVTWLDVAINWITSLIGNWLGTLIAAYFLSFLTGSFDGGIVQQYLHETAVAKTSYGWGQCFLRAIGCNTYVCLAVWFVISCDDAAGKIIALWFPIVAFAISGYQHIIANFYTLQVALMAGAPITVKDAVVWNFIPTLLGNMVGGCVLVGAVYWYNFYPSVGEIRGGAPSLKPERTSSRSELQMELSEKRKTFFGVPPASVSDMAQRDGDRRLLSGYVQSSETSHVKSLKSRFLGGSSDAASPREVVEVESRIGSEKPDIQVLSRVGEEEG